MALLVFLVLHGTRNAHLENCLSLPYKVLPLLYFKEVINAPCQDWSVAVGFLWKLVSFMHLFLYIKFVFLGLFLFRSRSSNTAQLQLSHLCSEKDSVEGRVLLCGVLWTAWSFLAKSTERHKTAGLPWDSADTLYTRAVCGVTSWVCCQVWGVILWWF